MITRLNFFNNFFPPATATNFSHAENKFNPVNTKFKQTFLGLMNNLQYQTNPFLPKCLLKGPEETE